MFKGGNSDVQSMFGDMEAAFDLGRADCRTAGVSLYGCPACERDRIVDTGRDMLSMDDLVPPLICRAHLSRSDAEWRGNASHCWVRSDLSEVIRPLGSLSELASMHVRSESLMSLLEKALRSVPSEDARQRRIKAFSVSLRRCSRASVYPFAGPLKDTNVRSASFHACFN